MLSIRDGAGGQYAPSLHQLRCDGETAYLFICTREENQGSGPLTVCLPQGQSVEEWDPQTGARFLADFEATGEGMAIRTELPACGSRLFVIRNDASALGPRSSHIQVISSRRNSFGPLHRLPPSGGWIGPGSFKTQGAEWTDDYSLVPYGLMAPPEIVTTSTLPSEVAGP